LLHSVSFKVNQSHRGRYQSKACMPLSISDLILTDMQSRTVSELSQRIVQILDILLFWAVRCYGWGTNSYNRLKIGILQGVGSAKFLPRRGRPPNRLYTDR